MSLGATFRYITLPLATPGILAAFIYIFTIGIATFDIPAVRRLFENHKDVEKAYYKKTGIFPIMHTVVIREELWKDSPWIAVSLFKAFQKAKEAAYQILNDSSPYKISMVWFREPLREQTEVFGEDPWPYGISKNRVAVETLMSYLYEQGLATRKLTFEEMFASNTVDL